MDLLVWEPIPTMVAIILQEDRLSGVCRTDDITWSHLLRFYGLSITQQ